MSSRQTLVPARRRRVLVVKTVHTGAFAIELASIAWLVVTGVTGRRDRTVVVAGSLVATEAVVFVVNRGVCPLTQLAERLGSGHGSVSDIFLPRRVAATIPIWSSLLVGLGLLLHLGGIASARWSGPVSRAGPADGA